MLAYERWELSYLYHLLLDEPELGTRELMTAMRQAEDSYYPARLHQYQLALQDTIPRIPQEYGAYMDYIHGWGQTLDDRHRMAQLLFEEILEREELLPDLRARIQRHLGITLVRQRKWSQAIPPL